nr:SRPBCC domain-containing protein [uncultured Carboxylicivirga sp.]
MAKEIKTAISIEASTEKIWSILTSFDKYPNWNPFIKELSGEVSAGNKIKVVIEPDGQKAMTFKPKVLSYVTNKEFTWKGHFIIPGIFDGEHRFKLIDNGDGSTTFVQSEKFNGVLAGLLNLENTEKGFKLMNEKLKELSEEK